MNGEDEEKKNRNGESDDDHPHTQVHALEDHTTKATVQLPPPDFPVEIYDSDGSSAASLKFEVKVDEDDSKTIVTDENGRFYLYKPKEKIELSLSSKDEPAPEQKTEPRKAANNDDVLTPVEVK